MPARIPAVIASHFKLSDTKIAFDHDELCETKIMNKLHEKVNCGAAIVFEQCIMRHYEASK